jgi:hypothetical protein
MADSLHQMTAEYVPAQDRILFRVNTQDKLEYRVWLTRRLVRNLWGVAVKSFEAKPEVTEQPRPQVKQAMMSMRPIPNRRRTPIRRCWRSARKSPKSAKT